MAVCGFPWRGRGRAFQWVAWWLVGVGGKAGRVGVVGWGKGGSERGGPIRRVKLEWEWGERKATRTRMPIGARIKKIAGGSIYSLLRLVDLVYEPTCGSRCNDQSTPIGAFAKEFDAPTVISIYIYIYNVPKGPAKIVKRCNDKLTRGGVKVGFGALAGYLE
jgi:hypothetical protein